MTEIYSTETILSRQLRQLAAVGVDEVVMTTGLFDQVLINYCNSLGLPLRYTFVNNPRYAETNYIYSIHCAKEHLTDSDILLMHGDLVFEDDVLERAIAHEGSCMTVSSTLPLPEKDFKAVVRDGMVWKVGINFFDDALAAQPLYKLRQEDWKLWLDRIAVFCEVGNTTCYAENALNELDGACRIAALDVFDALCAEVDTPEDLAVVSAKVSELTNRTVYMSFSTDMLHGGHIAIIKRAAKLGRLIVGVLSDEAVASYKRFPLMTYDDRKSLLESLSAVWRVVEQKTLSYAENLRKLRPTYVVHGDDWREGFQRPVREEVLEVLAEYGGRLIEYPYDESVNYEAIENLSRRQLAMPDIRRGRLRRLLAMKPLITVMEAHSGVTGLIVEKTTVYQEGKASQFDAMWISSLCDSTAKGKPDIELVDMSSRYRTVDDIMEVTTKPIILDGDTGGQIEHFVYAVRTLERMGVSAVIIEDKTGLKKNSLFGTDAEQTQDDVGHFSEKIRAGKQAQQTREFMIIARIESLILDKGMDDALARAYAFRNAGADGIMIHSRRKDPAEIFEFLERFRAEDSHTPLVVVPSSFNEVTEEEFARRGVNVVIYANQLTRSGFPAMQRAARTILENHRAKEADDLCMSIQEILTLIPEE